MSKHIDTCHVCGKALAECETIFAAEGALYCSEDCCRTIYTADEFAYMAEEISPSDIGLTDDK